jgi:putative hydrolases of HD superfamily
MGLIMTRLAQQLQFLVEVDKLKRVMRRTRLVADPPGAESRFENTAEHCWHIALAAAVLQEHSNAPIDTARVIRMLLVHDLVEIDAGDTPAFGVQGDKAEREALAATRIFGLLPEDQRTEFTALWNEFEARETADARFAHAMDRIIPVFQNMSNNGGSWVDFNVARDQAQARFQPVRDGSYALGDVIEKLLDESVELGYLRAK